MSQAIVRDLVFSLFARSGRRTDGNARLLYSVGVVAQAACKLPPGRATSVTCRARCTPSRISQRSRGRRWAMSLLVSSYASLPLPRQRALIRPHRARQRPSWETICTFSYASCGYSHCRRAHRAQGGRLVTERRMVSDMYVFDLKTFIWTKVDNSADPNLPGPRYFHSMDLCEPTRQAMRTRLISHREQLPRHLRRHGLQGRSTHS